MTNTVLIKRSGVANSVPVTGNLSLGELAINYADGNLFYKNSSGTVTVIASNKFLSVTGNVTGGNISSGGIVSATGNVTGNYFIGNGSQLTGITVSGTLSSTVDNFTGNGSQTAFVLSTTPSSENLTWVNIDGVDQLRTGYSVAGSTVTFSSAPASGASIEITTLSGSVGSNISIASGTSNVSIGAANANVTVGVNGTGNVAVFANSGVYVTGVVSATGNVTGNYIVGNGSLLTGVVATGIGTLASLSVTGNITTGNLLTGGLISVAGNITGGNLTTTGIASVGSLSVTGNVLGNLLPSANITYDLGSATQAWRDLYLSGTSIKLGAATITSSGTSVSVGTGNLTANNFIATTIVNAASHTGTVVSVTGNVNGGNLVSAALVQGATVSSSGNVNGVGIAASGNITGASVSTAGNVNGGNLVSAALVQGATVSSSGNVIAVGIAASGNISATANVQGGNGVFTTIVSAASHTGTLVSVTGNVNGGNLISAALVQGATVSSSGNVVTVGIAATGNISTTGNISGGNFIGSIAGTSTSLTGNLNANNVIATTIVSGASVIGGLVSVTGQITGSQFNGSGAGLTSIPGANVTGTVPSATSATTAGTVTTAAQPNITSLGNQTSTLNFNTIPNIIANALSSGASAIFKVAGSTGDTWQFGAGIVTAGDWGVTNVTRTANPIVITGGTATPIISVTGSVSASGNVNGGNLITAALVQGATLSSSGNVVTVGVAASGNISATANVQGGNGVFTTIVSAASHTGGLVSVTGTVTGSQFNGSGAGLSSIPGANVTGTVPNATTAVVAGTVTTAAQGNITSVGTLSSLAVTANVTANNFIATTIVSAASHTGGLVSVTGQITGSQFNGSGAGLTSIPGANVSGTVPNATTAVVAGTVTTAAQGNITSVGTLSSLLVTNNVGIGITSPVAKLVVAATGGHSFEFAPNNTTDTNWLQNYNRTTSAYTNIIYNAASHQFYVSGLLAVTVDSSGNVILGYNQATSKQVVKSFATAHDPANRGGEVRFGINDGSFGGIIITNAASSNPAYNAQYVTFETHQGGVSAGERMRITADGYVGIATTTPAALLQIGPTSSGAINGYTKFIIDSTDYAVATLKSPAANFNQIIFTDPTATSLGGINYFNSTNATPNAMAFLTAATERMRIDSNGNLGIGTTTPVRKLTVSSAGSCEFVLQDTSQAANSRNWRLFNTSNTLYFGTLNDAGTSGTDVMHLTSGADLRFNSGYGSVATAYGCRAWISFDGNSATIRGSGNVASLTDLGVGVYNVNFTTGMPDANYAVTTGVSKNGGGASGSNSAWVSAAEARGTGYFLLEIWNLNNSYVDVSNIFAAVFR